MKLVQPKSKEHIVKSIELSDSQRSALTLAYAQGYCCEEGTIGDFDSGVYPATIRSLVRKGFIEPDPDDGCVGYRATEAGRAALGVVLQPPTSDLVEALKRAIELFFGETDPYISTPPIGRVLLHDELEYDFARARALVLDIPQGTDRGEVEWGAVESMLLDLGFRVAVEIVLRGRTAAGIWGRSGGARRKRLRRARR